MADVFQDFPIKGSARQVFEAVSTPAGLDAWWSQKSSGQAEEGAEYKLGFGDGYEWVAKVSRFNPDTEFEFELTSADADWQGTRVGFLLEENNGVTQVRFHHTGWPVANEHYRVSCHCWALYLRLLRRYVERDEIVDYENRLDA